MPISLTQPPFQSKVGKKSGAPANAAFAAAEINAYIAIRDELLAEAEQSRTRAKLDSATVANDFVQNCLKPARGPYSEQCLPESDAARQRKRCETARDRIAKLRAVIN